MMRSSRFLVISFIVLIGLIATLYILKRQASGSGIAPDTLVVTAQGLNFRQNPVEIGNLRKLYPEGNKQHKLHVVFDPDVEFGKTWEVEDSLKELLKTRKNLTITGLPSEVEVMPVE